MSNTYFQTKDHPGLEMSDNTSNGMAKTVISFHWVLGYIFFSTAAFNSLTVVSFVAGML